LNNAERILIIGNSGSGKTWLGRALSVKMNLPLFHMDAIRWDKGGYEIRRSAAEIKKDLDDITQQKQWILEGVFGKMAKECLPFSTTLIWLDLPWEDCKQNLLSRGPQFETVLSPSERETALDKLIEWAGEHYSRSDTNSWEFFNMLYTSFPNRKVCLHHREEINGFLDRIHKDPSQ